MESDPLLRCRIARAQIDYSNGLVRPIQVSRPALMHVPDVHACDLTSCDDLHRYAT